MRVFIFIPPLAKLSGGLAVLFQVAKALKGYGYEVHLLCTRLETQGAFVKEQLAAGFTFELLNQANPAPSDLWIVPEGWPNALAPGVKAGARALVFVQGWNQMLGVLPQGTHWRDLPVRFIAVSEPVSWFLKNILDLPCVGVIPPALNELFSSELGSETIQSIAPVTSIRISWMPRKNRALAENIRQILDEGSSVRAGARGGYPPIEWVPIQNMSLEEVAHTLSSCHIFLNTAFPEGFGLPPLEAMACGALPVGFTGFGGWDYMRQGLPGLYAPPMPLSPRPWSGNGLYAADGDVLSAAMLLDKAVRMLVDGDPLLEQMRLEGAKAAQAYSLPAQEQALKHFFSALS